MLRKNLRAAFSECPKDVKEGIATYDKFTRKNQEKKQQFLERFMLTGAFLDVFMLLIPLYVILVTFLSG